MTERLTYGSLFLNHLTAISRQTAFSYKDLQQIKAMNREELADKLKSECPQIAEVILSKSAEEVAELVHSRRMELAAASTRASTATGATSLVELILQIFAASV